VAKHAFPKYDLDVYDEPYISVQDGDSDDEDIQDTSSDKDIQNLLSKYLKEEDDSDIVSAIKGGASSLAGGAGAGSGNGEKYERLPPEERAFLTFASRIKRAPKQVARYAYGGVPLWSM
jgi:NADH:ubiquinone oxidoreductase subunit F (NADH-binding)